MEQFEKGFFEFISAAGNEKVHSQIIGWIFSGNCEALADNSNNSLLKCLLEKVNLKGLDLKIERVEVEIYDIDILLECEDRFVVIENKIKSTEHSNQLDKYEYITARDEAVAKDAYARWKDEAPYTNKQSTFEKYKHSERFYKKVEDPIYLYLSLIEENPKSKVSDNGSIENNNNKTWKNITYKNLYIELNKIYQNETLSKNDSIILGTYIQTLKRLTHVIETFCKDPKNIPHIFKEGKSRAKVNDVKKLTIHDYVRENQLETLLQKMIYTNIRKELRDIKGKITISETRGWALMDIMIGRIKLIKTDYNVILQFQGHSIKFGIAPVTKIENTGSIEDIRNGFANKLKDIGQALLKEAFNIENEDESKNDCTLKSKMSSPKSVNGFISIPLFKNGKDQDPWQNNKDQQVELVMRYYERAKRIKESMTET